MHVVILNDYAEANGGSSVVALSSARGLASRGVPVTLFTAVASPRAESVECIPGLHHINLGQEDILKDPNRLRAFRNGIANQKAAIALRRLLATFDPQNTVVHVHSYMKALSPLALDVPLRMGFKTILSLHDYFISCPTGVFFVHRKSEICERRPLSISCLTCACDRRSYAHKLWRSARTGFQNRVLGIDRRLSLYLGISHFSIRTLRPWLPPGVPVRILRNPVDLIYAEPAPVAASAPFVFIGRFAKEKGPLLFAEAVRRTGVPAIFIGDGELLPEARRICPGATFTGWLSAAAVNDRLRCARALVFPSLWYETLGMVVLEAAANGVPAIVSDRCAATDFIAHNENGLHFQHGSVESLCAQIRELQSPLRAAQLGRRTHEWYWNNPWTLENHVEELLNIYHFLLSSGSNYATRHASPGQVPR